MNNTDISLLFGLVTEAFGDRLKPEVYCLFPMQQFDDSLSGWRSLMQHLNEQTLYLLAIPALGPNPHILLGHGLEIKCFHL